MGHRMKYQIDITRIEIVEEDGDVAIEIEALGASTAQVTMNVHTTVADWNELANAVSQSLLLMQLKVPK